MRMPAANKFGALFRPRRCGPCAGCRSSSSLTVHRTSYPQILGEKDLLADGDGLRGVGGLDGVADGLLARVDLVVVASRFKLVAEKMHFGDARLVWRLTVLQAEGLVPSRGKDVKGN